jgi:predicted aldo/keto reductase-like oxidoreductase
MDEAVKVIKESLDLGINFFDTAIAYTDSEDKIGLAIKGIPRHELVIATKSPANDKKTFLEHVDASLKRLKLDYIDIYQLHGVSSEEVFNKVMAQDGAFEGLELAIKQGKVRFPGFSSHTMPIAKKMLLTNKFYSMQIPFNFIDREAEEEVIPLAKRMNMGIIAMKPLGGGLLDNANLCFKYLMQFDGVVPDPGIEKPGEMRQIADVVNKMEPLTSMEKELMEKIRKETGDHWCHRCDYCQPCPNKIRISMVLNIKALIKRMPYERAFNMAGNFMPLVDKCTECNSCINKCPYNLDIPKLLKQNQKYWHDYVKNHDEKNN